MAVQFILAPFNHDPALNYTRALFHIRDGTFGG